MPVALAGSLPADADGVAHDGPAVSLSQETADLLLDFDKELAVLRHQGSQVVCTRRLVALGVALPAWVSIDRSRRDQRREACRPGEPRYRLPGELKPGP
jgi:hypothetical protein